MANPFKMFKVEPAYGAFRAIVNMTLSGGVSGGVYIYRSANGATGWKLLNPEAPVTLSAGGFFSFADTDLGGEFNSLPYYRGVVDPSGGGPETWLPGPPVAAFSHLNRFHRSRILKILRREYRHMSGTKTSGSIVFHYIPLEDGETVSRYDAETGQLLGPPCPGDAGDQGYGTPYKGGFYPPLQTWARMIQAAPIKDTSVPDATRTDQTADAVFRFLAHPQPRKDHMIVLAGSDRRYVVGTAITPYYFPGTNVPIAWEASCSLLPPKDARHDLPVPLPVADPSDGSLNVTGENGGEVLGDGDTPFGGA